jgi:YgiT-type zinc finger domain-containing protein
MKGVVMKCSICKTGQTHPGNATITLQKGEAVVVLRGVPAEVCEDCGEYYLDAEVTRRVYSTAEESLKQSVEVEILRDAA